MEAADGPDAAAPRVSGVLLRMLAELASQRGIAPEALFLHQTEHLLTSEPLTLRVPLSEYGSWLARTIALTGDPALGLRGALGTSESAFDLMAPLIAHVPTLRDAIRELQRFCPLVLEGAYLFASEGAGTACLRWEMPRTDLDTDRTLAELLNAGLVRLLRGFRCAPEELLAVRFEHRSPKHACAYAELLGERVRFGQPFTGVELDAKVLDRKSLHANPALHTLMQARAEQCLERIARPLGLVDRLQSYLRNQADQHVPEMPSAARALGVSTRSLRRRLADEGLTYRELTQRLQCERARVMLRDPAFTPQAIADVLGFADATAFHRAFKRWTGQTAGEYRAEHVRSPLLRLPTGRLHPSAGGAPHAPGVRAASFRA